MADVFISYSRADAGFVDALVPVLAEAGLSVWWDRNIVGGTEFHRVIENEINAAAKVVVLWSKTSVESVWVRDEAGLARDQGKLVPLAIDDCVIPLGFRSIHTLRSAAVDLIADDLLIACGCRPRAKAETPRAAEPIEREAAGTATGKASAGEAGAAPGHDREPGASGADGTGSFDSFGNIFDELFGKKPTGTEPARGSDLRYNHSLSLEEAFAGKIASIVVPTAVACASCAGSGAKPGATVSKCLSCDGHGKVRAQQGYFAIEKACPACGGRGEVASAACEACEGAGRVTRDRKLQVNIPAGVESGTRIRLAGEGEEGHNGGEAGDLYIFLDVTPHEFFQRDGADLTCRVPVPITLAALGGPVEVPSLEGGLVRVRVPGGMQAGQSLRLKGRGMSRLREEARGDLFVRTEVETPQGLGAMARDVVQELRTLRPTAESRNANCPVEERGPDLSCEVVVSVFDAALGADITFSTEGGPTLRLRVPEGTQNGQLFRLRGLGREGGDLYVTVRTEMPAGLTGQELDLLGKLQDLGGEVTNAESGSFMDRVRALFRADA